jgi:hypothetical protein
VPVDLNNATLISLEVFREKTRKISGDASNANVVIVAKATTAKLEIALTESSSPSWIYRVNRGTSDAAKTPPS